MERVIQSVAEYVHLNEMQDTLSKKLQESRRKDLGRLDSLRAGILGMVVAENYDRAKEELEAYVDLKVAYPGFQARVKRYVQHCSELIQAVATKRNFPGLSTLSLAKQQEIHEKVIEHFEDLKHHLKQIEKVERDQKLTDIRSTVWVVRAASVAVAVLMAFMFVLDVQSDTFGSVFTVGDVMLDDAIAKLMKTFHL